MNRRIFGGVVATVLLRTSPLLMPVLQQVGLRLNIAFNVMALHYIISHYITLHCISLHAPLNQEWGTRSGANGTTR
jgi:hypothetical protein